MNKVILDLDGTLCDITHRMPYYESHDWDTYNSLIPNDRLNPRVNRLVNALESDGYEIIVLTGRYEKFRAMTKKWLHDHISFSYSMIMKSNDDNRSSVFYKIEWIKKNCHPSDWVIDDRVEIYEICKTLNIGYIKPSML